MSLEVLPNSASELLSPAEVAQAISEYLARRKPAASLGLSSAIEQHLAHLEAEKRRLKTVNNRRSSCQRLRAYLGDVPMSDITTDAVRGFLDVLGGSAVNFNSTLREVRALFGWAVEKQILAINPAAEKRIKPKEIDRDLVQILSLDQCVALMEHVERFKSGSLAPYIAISLFCGLRPAEVRRLAGRPELIDLNVGVIHVTTAISKTKTPRLVTLRSNVQNWFARYGSNLKPVNFERDIAEVRQACGLSQDVLRHSFCSYHLGMWGDFASESLEAGHSPEIARRHYLSRVSKSDAVKFWSITPAG